MRFYLARPTLAALIFTGSTLGIGCSEAPAEDPLLEASTDPITDITSSAVKRQSVGNCWLYATSSWAESLVKQAGQANGAAEEPNMSESYWTYWHWFDQIANGRASSEIETGGFYQTAVQIMTRYGIVAEGDFIPTEATEERSMRQKEALAKINESLKTGALSTPKARRDRAAIRAELDAAFALEPNVIEQMDRIFARGVTRTLDRSQVSLKGTMIKRPSDFQVLVRDPQTKKPVTATLQDAIGTRSSSRFAWRTVSYGWDAASRRSLLARVQRAMHDGQPVIMSWHVDFAAMKDGQFLAPPETPGAQGGHMVVVEDYQVTDVPGFGTLPAGVVETRPEALAAALAPESKIEFIRVKNSWGTHRPDPLQIGPGYHDLYMRYLDGPIKQCTQVEGTSDPDDCWDDTPLNNFTLPPGY
jgi:hypothetical protein